MERRNTIEDRDDRIKMSSMICISSIGRRRRCSAMVYMSKSSLLMKGCDVMSASIKKV